MKVSIFDNWLHTSRKGNGCVYRNENKMKVEKESWGWEQQGRYTYTTGAEATGCSRRECWAFPPIFSNQCYVVLIVLLLGSLFFPASVFFVSVNASRIAQPGSECHTQFCLAGIMIPLRQSYCDWPRVKYTTTSVRSWSSRSDDDSRPSSPSLALVNPTR